MPVHPQITKYAREISSRTKYPIANLGQLVKAVGEDTVIEFEGARGTAKEVSRIIPDHFFPVASEEDLLKKSEELRATYMRKG
jgi:hypothetical protein